MTQRQVAHPPACRTFPQLPAVARAVVPADSPAPRTPKSLLTAGGSPAPPSWIVTCIKHDYFVYIIYIILYMIYDCTKPFMLQYPILTHIQMVVPYGNMFIDVGEVSGHHSFPSTIGRRDNQPVRSLL